MNRIIFPVLMLMFLSCTKHERKQRPNLNPTGFSIEIRMNDKSPTGQITEMDAPVGTIHVWKSDNKNLEVISVGAAIGGYATDLLTDRLESAYYSSLSSTAAEKASPGKYFVFVNLDGSPSVGKFSYSYTSFEVINGQQTKLKKTFTSRVSDSEYEEWHASE